MSLTQRILVDERDGRRKTISSHNYNGMLELDSTKRKISFPVLSGHKKVRTV